MSAHGSSTLFTVGLAIRQAMEQDQPVRALIDGVWVYGKPTNSDSQSVVMATEYGDLVLRTDLIAAVYINPQVPANRRPKA